MVSWYSKGQNPRKAGKVWLTIQNLEGWRKENRKEEFRAVLFSSWGGGTRLAWEGGEGAAIAMALRLQLTIFGLTSFARLGGFDPLCLVNSCVAFIRRPENAS